MLNQLYKDGEINETLKNVSKSTFDKLEQFFADKIETNLKLEKVDNEIEGNSLLFSKQNNVNRLFPTNHNFKSE